MGEIRLMKGNEAIAEAAIRAGCDAYFGYPITPQSEIIEYLANEDTVGRTGMKVLQAESEIASINMVYGAAGTGKKVMTTSSSPGISLMQEGISYIAGAELPCVIVNVVRGGPGLGTIQPSQSDYFQAVKGGGHGDYKMLVLAPASVQEMADHTKLAFELAFKYRNPVMILSDGLIGQMMEKIELFDQQPRATDFDQSWVITGKPKNRPKNYITSLVLDPYEQEKHNLKLQAKYHRMEKEDTLYEEYLCDDADYIIVAFGSAARIAQKVVEMARENGIKAGLIRPITLFPFPNEILLSYTSKIKGILVLELNAGQMTEDVERAVRFQTPVNYYGRIGGVVPSPDEVYENFIKTYQIY